MSFRPYPEYKPSGVTWLGDVPAHWAVKRVRDVAQIVNGYPFDSERFNPDEGLPLVRIRDLDQLETQVRYDGPQVDAAVITSDDLLIGMDGDFNVGRWRGEGPALLNQRMCCVRGQSSLVTRALEYALPLPLRGINELTYATTVKHLSSFQVEKIRIALPPDEAEIARIVAFLDSETAEIDALVAEQQRLIELLQEKRQAVISHAVTKGLDPAAPMKDSGVDWLGQVPAHWPMISLKRIARVQTGVAKGGRDYDGKLVASVPYLRVANVQDGYLDLHEVAQIVIPLEDVPRYSLQRGDVLMNEGGDFDKLGRGHIWQGQIEPCIHQNHVFAVRPQHVSSRWLNAYTGSAAAQFYFKSRSKQSTNLASISSTNLMELPVVLPPTDEQDVILQHINEQTGRYQRLIEAALRAIELLVERRTAVISAAVAGRLNVLG